eukprot:TRINITY_DN12667_c0_g1_i2.p1 TRINITY_DN12667_c0_g1~~TRINITY_DN12667_c0_g1_i2.p1  ORF type:complete len:346 (+),score=70.34 TRINITY_DN12667_c0_g1_i2:24-1040(+)
MRAFSAGLVMLSALFLVFVSHRWSLLGGPATGGPHEDTTAVGAAEIQRLLKRRELLQREVQQKLERNIAAVRAATEQQQREIRKLQDMLRDHPRLSPADILKYSARGGHPPSAEECRRLTELLTPRHNCNHPERFGSKGDGGYTLCLDQPLTAPSTSCTAYSFGIGQDWSFDEDLSGQCYVHAFDPTLLKKNATILRYQGRQIDFRKWGITQDGRVFLHRGVTPVKTKTLAATMQALGHNRLDVLKLSIDEGEWEVLASLRGGGHGNGTALLGLVSHLVVELHFHYVQYNLSLALDALSAPVESGLVPHYTTFRPGNSGTGTFLCGTLKAEIGYMRPV